MNRQLQFLAILFVFSLFITLIFAADPDFAEYEQPSPIAVSADPTTADVTPTAAGWLEHLKFWERHTWRDFYFEYALLSLVSVYYALHRYGRGRNEALAQKWIKTNSTLLSDQFAQFGIPSVDGRVVPLSHDGGSVFESYATGRINISRLWVEMNLVSRNDFVGWIVEAVAGFFFDWVGSGGEDLVEVIIDPSAEWEGFAWAVVRKAKMRKLRDNRYGLGFTRITESSAVPATHAILTELPEITETLFIQKKALLKAIEDSSKWFEYLIISDFPDETPKNVEALKRGMKNRITLVTKLPTSDDGLVATSRLLEQVILLVDSLDKHKFRSEVSKKLKNTRSEAVTRFTKSLAALEETPSQQDIAQKKKAEKEKAEKERVAKLSAEEQRKYVEKERKSRQSKMQKTKKM